MSELMLITSECFEEINCDIYYVDNEFYMTREQIGAALEYSEPRVAIAKLHERHRERLDRFSTVTRLVTDDGREREVFLYNRKGIMEICRWSGQPKADNFMDWVWDVMDTIISGKYELVPTAEYNRKIAESRRINSQVKKAREYIRLADLYRGTIYAQVLDSHATFVLSGEHLIPLPKAERRTYSASEIGERLGITANKVGILANRNNLKTDEYGLWVHDIAANKKQVQTFRYFEEVIPVLEELSKASPPK